MKRTTKDDRGAILITMLLVVSVMTAVVALLLGDLKRSVGTAATGEETSRIHWQLVGASAAGKHALNQALQAQPDKNSTADAWAKPQEFPVVGGTITAQVSDGGWCLNVNALTADGPGDGDDAARTAYADQKAFFTALAASVGIDEERSARLLAELQDWIDRNQEPSPNGREDFDYLRRAPASRTPSTSIVNIESLSRLYSITPALYARLAPYLCALPRYDQPALNPNTMEVRHAVLLAAASGGRIALEEAAQLLAQRPPRGWAHIDEFFSEKPWGTEPVPPAVKHRFSVQSQYFTLHARLIYRERTQQLYVLYERTLDDDLKTALIRMGDFE